MWIYYGFSGAVVNFIVWISRVFSQCKQNYTICPIFISYNIEQTSTL